GGGEQFKHGERDAARVDLLKDLTDGLLGRLFLHLDRRNPVLEEAMINLGLETVEVLNSTTILQMFFVKLLPPGGIKDRVKNDGNGDQTEFQFSVATADVQLHLAPKVGRYLSVRRPRHHGIHPV